MALAGQLVVDVSLVVEVVGNVLDLVDIEMDLEEGISALDRCHGELLPWPVPGDGPCACDVDVATGDGVWPGDVDVVLGHHEDGVVVGMDVGRGGGRVVGGVGVLLSPENRRRGRRVFGEEGWGLRRRVRSMALQIKVRLLVVLRAAALLMVLVLVVPLLIIDMAGTLLVAEEGGGVAAASAAIASDHACRGNCEGAGGGAASIASSARAVSGRGGRRRNRCR